MAEPRPILRKHIEAGRTLCGLLDSRRASIQALDALREKFPGHDPDACMLKAVAVNALLGTRVSKVWTMVESIYGCLSEAGQKHGPALVDLIAGAAPDGKNHPSFASKYAHFFFDPGRYPIYDQHVARTLAHHRRSHRIWPKSYVEFFAWFEELKPYYEPHFTLREVDQYLWMAGMVQYKRKWGDGELSEEVLKLFDNPDPRVKQALDELALDP